MVTSSKDIALQVIQQAIAALAKWANFAHPPLDNEYPEVSQAKKILGWTENTTVGTLRLLFDSVKLSDGQGQNLERQHYHRLKAIENDNQEYPDIPYPLNSEPSQAEQEAFKVEINNEFSKYLNNNEDNWQNLSLLMLILEKLGSCLSFGESNVALVDIARVTAAIATSLINNTAKEISLIAGDLSGIQKFIYTISSDGALKSLRARSFYLELVTEEIVQQLLSRLKLPRTNVIYSGGGNLYILASATEENLKIVQQVRQQFNKWLLDEFQGKVFLALDCLNFPIKEITSAEFAIYWSNATKNLAVHKSQKFVNQISNFIDPSHSHEPCRVCHRDDVEPEKLNPLNTNEPDSVLACGTCRSMFDLGSNLFGVKAIVRSTREDVGNKLPTLSFQLPASDDYSAVNIYYHCFKTWKPIVSESDMVLLVNDWILEHYQFKHFKNVYPLLLGNYGKANQTENNNAEEVQGFMRAEEMAAIAKGINRVGYLRMDVDRLGQIFAKGLGENQTLPRLAGLSRQMSYFFKVYLNSLAQKRQANIPENIKQSSHIDEKFNILFIYAGGDDLFVSGAWNEVVDFAFDVYQSFRAYTGNNTHITLSGGISIDDSKFPLYQAAKSSGDTEDAAKGNGRDSLGLFGQVFKWDEWLGSENINVADIEILSNKTKQYLGTDITLDLFGIFPLVNKIEQQQIELNYARAFVRNLLDTAQIQELKIKDIHKKRKQQQYEGEIKDISYYLHLPKIAYALSRLPKKILENDDFTPIRKSLINPYNAPYFRAIATWLELLNRSS
ncbi:Csm1 family CRISPR-associated protein [Nostoc sp. NIES-2111]|nr:Csm1 family CRISPR-associated protein [Nostoc sp. NIES-2111]